MPTDTNKPVKPKQKVPAASLANLRPFETLSPEEARAIRSKGGKISQQRKRENKTFKETVQWLMEQPAFATTNDIINALKEVYPDITNAEAMSAAVMGKVLNEGDARAYTTIRDTSGEVPDAFAGLKGDASLTITIKTLDDDKTPSQDTPA